MKTIEEIIRENQSTYGYGSFEYQILNAWRNGTEEQKTELALKFPELFCDSEIKWRKDSELENVKSGYFWNNKKEMIFIESNTVDYFYTFHGDEERYFSDFPDASYYGPLKAPDEEPNF